MITTNCSNCTFWEHEGKNLGQDYDVKRNCKKKRKKTGSLKYCKAYEIDEDFHEGLWNDFINIVGWHG